MKRIIGMIIAIITVAALTVPAYAVNLPPEYQKQYEDIINERSTIEARMQARTEQFNKDNPGVSWYILTSVYGAPGIYKDAFGNFYSGYNGYAYYLKKGTTTFNWSDGRQGTAWMLYPDPNPSITAKYVQETNADQTRVNELDDLAYEVIAKGVDSIDVSAFTPYFDDPSACVVFQIGNCKYYSGVCNIGINMIEEGNYNAIPYIINNRTLIPIRPLIESLGGKVDWNGDLMQVSISINGTDVVMTIGNKYAYVNGVKTELDVPAVISNGKTMIPVRFVAESLGYDVEWVQDSSLVVIRYSQEPKTLNFRYSSKLMTLDRTWVGGNTLYAIFNTSDSSVEYEIDIGYKGDFLSNPDNAAEYDVTSKWISEGIPVPTMFRVYEIPGEKSYSVIVTMNGHTIALKFMAYRIEWYEYLTETQINTAREAVQGIVSTLVPVYE